MINQQTLTFLSQLKKNNNRPWFEKNRALYEAALTDVRTFIDELIESSSSFDKSISGLKSKDCLMRIYRDVRFSKNKDPYKSNFGVPINKGGKKMPFAGYYLHITPGGSFAAGGMWMPEADKLQKVRQEILYNVTQFKKIINNAAFKKSFGKLDDEDMLKTSPKGFDKEFADIGLLKYKSYLVVHNFSDREVTAKDFVKNCSSVFKTMKPLIDFLNEAIQ